MIFRKDMERYCILCRHSRPMDEEGEQMVCPKKGIVVPNYCCRHYEYDPLKRMPPQKAVMDFSRFSEEDFTL